MTVEKAEEIIRIRLSKTMREKRITPAILARKTGISESVIRGYIQEGKAGSDMSGLKDRPCVGLWIGKEW